MSALCGIWRPGRSATKDDEQLVLRMLTRVSYRGDTNVLRTSEGLTIALRTWNGRSEGELRAEGKGVFCIAGKLLSAHADLPNAFDRQDVRASLDGAFAAAWLSQDGAGLRLMRDPFGVRSLYYFVVDGTVCFASELKQLLALPSCSTEVDLSAIHKYLTFSFVPGEAVPIRGVRRVLPGQIATFKSAELPSTENYFELEQSEDERFNNRDTAVTALREVAKQAVTARIVHGEPVALYLSGGLDSAAMAVWLKSRGATTTLLTLDFGEQSVERDEAAAVANVVGFEHAFVAMNGSELANKMPLLASILDLPFGDTVTGPQMMLGLAAKARGIAHVLNGEGGDQLFGGWTNKPMIAAEIYGGLLSESAESREETYLRSYHRFYGMEESLYTDNFREQIGGKGQRRAHLAPYLATDQVKGRDVSFLNRVRLADIALKGSQNILPRAERIAAGLGLSISVPLFDRKLAEYSFRLPSEMKLFGACEKYVLKMAMQGRLPDEIVWRKKFGMSVPMTDWLMGPLKAVVEEYVGDRTVRARGWFKPESVAKLRSGIDHVGETRKRRIGEKLWTLIMLEAWVRHVVEERNV
jgi:asparagine synthase (glutamine-hydrolysing)